MRNVLRAADITKRHIRGETYQSISSDYGVTGARIQQIDKSVRKKLRDDRGRPEIVFIETEVIRDIEIDTDFTW